MKKSVALFSFVVAACLARLVVAQPTETTPPPVEPAEPSGPVPEAKLVPDPAPAPVVTPAAPPAATVVATPPPAAAAAAPPPVAAKVVDEPHADRVVLAPTAYTHPAGTFFVSSYDLVFLQVGYALTDRTQISVTATPPLGEPGELRLALVDATLKSAVVREGLVRVAALGSVSGVATSDPGVLLVGRVGGVVQLCLRPECQSSLSISSNVLLLGPVLLMANGVGAIVRAGRYLSFVAELDTVVPLGREGGSANAVLLGGGLRLHWARFAVDLSLLGGVGRTDAAVPVIALTYRTEGGLASRFW